jgi:hypothetical protein
MRVCIDKCQPIFVGRPLITNIDPDVVIFGDLPLEVTAYFLIGFTPEHLPLLRPLEAFF